MAQRLWILKEYLAPFPYLWSLCYTTITDLWIILQQSHVLALNCRVLLTQESSLSLHQNICLLEINRNYESLQDTEGYS